ncbi:DUF3152 domain-containing protein [Nocardioides sp. zg-579]|uniref:DUF3152 domain-containing protein n=1 Tax=Nocardioides marmotae TaxID=2663857 RepID=A0A6I3JFZ1_9ACTN|nr:DUF3152 domain-containing protein [Nocardioides marmotae]MCR6033298.1 DUF3152 domain-containing protein [Gordonia jinghuaiqii]MTB96955.1 DUF3152 domain-containing protein [Nocardioides marmotae]QKE00663.1 DUF3152 domain-containing protein [Nocardioides marmotae]
MGLTRLLAALLLGAALLVAAPGAASAEPVPTAPPVVKGEPVFGQRLVAGAGRWEGGTDGLTLTYRWLRGGEPVPGATDRTHELGLDDLGRRLSVEVTATDSTGAATTVRSAPTDRVRRAPLWVRTPARVTGVARFGRVVRVAPGEVRPLATRVRVRWLVAGRPVARERGLTYRLRPGDVGRRVRAEVVHTAPGHTTLRQRTAPRSVRHRVDVRRTVTYSVQTRGRLTTSLATFRRQAQQTYEDARGWRGSGVRFVPVRRGGSFTLVLAAAAEVPRFSPVCSAQWSCRVGRYVVINQERWKHASPAWNAARGALRDYRHMVVNHETGHWLGRGHATCGGRGQPAPVMQQQSKGLGGCRFNPWPTLAELR